MASKLIKITQDILREVASDDPNEILHGLRKGETGAILSAPDQGKGYLCLSLCYELAAGLPLLGLSKNLQPKRVLYWPIEDGTHQVLKRIHQHFTILTEEDKHFIQENLVIFDCQDPISVNETSQQSSIHQLANKTKAALIKAAMPCDLIIIDTLREASGNCHEVRDDYQVKVALQDIAMQSNSALLFTHHLTKEVARGNEAPTSVSGSGFSETLANSRYHLMLKKVKERGKPERTLLSHTKKNNLQPDRVYTNVQCCWNAQSLIKIIDEPLRIKSNETKPTALPSHIGSKDAIEPKELDLRSVSMSKDSAKKAEDKKNQNSIFSASDLEKIAEFKKKRNGS